MQDYSQDSEQVHILTACPEDHGRFLDIGAWHPIEKSNTRALFERGWDGVIVEPSPIPFSNLKAEYEKFPERITLINAAAGIHPGMCWMWITADATSTADPVIYRKWQGTVKYDPVQVEVPIITLEQLYRHGSFGFVNLDTEGSSVELFKRLLELGHRPRCICLEYDERLDEADEFARMVGYRRVLLNGTNIVLVYGE